MAITCIVGFDDVARLQLQNLTDLTAIENVPFVALKDNQSGSTQESYFKLTQHAQRGWLSTHPHNSSRQPESYCYCSDYSGYPRYYCYDRARRHDTTATNNKRRIDSSLRTPCLGIDFNRVWSAQLTDNQVDAFIHGGRIYFPTGFLEGNRFVTIAMKPSGDLDGYYNDTNFTVFTKTEINDRLVRNSVYVEVEVNRRTGIVRRWINSEELPAKVLPASYLAAFETLRFQYGEKSRSVDGQTYSWHEQPSYYGCPTSRTSQYDYDAGAPQDQEFSVTDFYFVADTLSSDTDLTHCERLGDVEVHDMDVSNFLLSQYWTPYSGENPKDTVNRLKAGRDIPVPGVLGDTNAEAATVLIEPPTYELGEEIIYSEIYAWGAPEDVSVPLQMDVTPLVGQEALPNVHITLRQTTFEPRNTIRYSVVSLTRQGIRWSPLS